MGVGVRVGMSRRVGGTYPRFTNVTVHTAMRGATCDRSL